MSLAAIAKRFLGSSSRRQQVPARVSFPTPPPTPSLAVATLARRRAQQPPTTEPSHGSKVQPAGRWVMGGSGWPGQRFRRGRAKRSRFETRRPLRNAAACTCALPTAHALAQFTPRPPILSTSQNGCCFTCRRGAPRQEAAAERHRVRRCPLHAHRHADRRTHRRRWRRPRHSGGLDGLSCQHVFLLAALSQRQPLLAT